MLLQRTNTILKLIFIYGMYGIYRSKDKSFKLYYNPQAPLKTSYACGSKAATKMSKKKT